MKKINHHSTSDWNFNNTNYILATDYYISPPSSLKFTSFTNFCLLKQSVAGGPIAEGIIKTWLRFRSGATAARSYPFYFRNQAADGSVGSIGYFLDLRNSSQTGAGVPLNAAALVFSLDGTNMVVIEEKAISPTLSPDTWHLLRVKFFISGTALVVVLEYWNGEEWAQLCGAFSDGANRWATSSTNRVGIRAIYCNASPYYSWYDDTEIYRRVY